MSQPRLCPKALLFFSIIFDREKISPIEIQKALYQTDLEIIKEDAPLDSVQRYYGNEMGENLSREWWVQVAPLEREKLVDWKLKSLSIEEKFSTDGLRSVNIDPGLICLENLILSTFKPFGHRIYLGRGVYADLTLQFQNKSYQSMPWTYPDYAREEVINWFNLMRREYLASQKEGHFGV